MENARLLRSLYSRVSTIPWLPSVVIYVLLVILAFVVYWQPLRMHFWGGCDEQGCMVNADFDAGKMLVDHWMRPPGGRPLAFIPLRIFGHYLNHDQVEGFIVLAFVLWLANALLLKAILHQLFPDTPVIGTAAAILLIVHRAEPLRYWVMWSALFYLLPLFWFLLALWILLLSFKQRNYWLLVLACGALSISMLGTEGVYPMVLIGPALLWLKKEDLISYAKWASAWMLTSVVWAVQFLYYLASQGSASYQARQAGDVFTQPLVLLGNLGTKLHAILDYVKIDLPDSQYILRWLVIASCAAALFVVSNWRPSVDTPRKRLIFVLLVGGLWAILGILPFLHIRDAFRTQFLAAPGQAVLWACVLALLASWLPNKLNATTWVAALVLIAASSGVHSYEHQANVVRGYPVSFAKTTYIFEQIEGISPALPQGSLILFESENLHESPLGPNYHVRRIAEITLGVGAAQINYEDPIGETTTLSDEGVHYVWGRDRSDLVGYENVIIFRLERSGALSLVTKLPDTLSDEARAAYRPLERVSPGSFKELRYLRPTILHAPLVSLTSGRNGVICGNGWTKAELDTNGNIKRGLGSLAELIINPQERETIILELDFVTAEKSSSDSAVEVSLLDENHEILATRTVQSGKVGFPLRLSKDSLTRVFVRSSVPNLLVSRVASRQAEAHDTFLVARPARGSDVTFR